MMMIGMEFLNKEPFKDIYVHALVRDEKGQKMSKSKGNVIDPLELIEKYSADALRFTFYQWHLLDVMLNFLKIELKDIEIF